MNQLASQLSPVKTDVYDMSCVEFYDAGTILGVRGPTWLLSPKVTKESLFKNKAHYLDNCRDYGSLSTGSVYRALEDPAIMDRRATDAAPTVDHNGQIVEWLKPGPAGIPQNRIQIW